MRIKAKGPTAYALAFCAHPGVPASTSGKAEPLAAEKAC